MSARRYTVNQNEAINAMTDLARCNQVDESAYSGAGNLSGSGSLQ